MYNDNNNNFNNNERFNLLESIDDMLESLDVKIEESKNIEITLLNLRKLIELKEEEISTLEEFQNIFKKINKPDISLPSKILIEARENIKPLRDNLYYLDTQIQSLKEQIPTNEEYYNQSGYQIGTNGILKLIETGKFLNAKFLLSKFSEHYYKGTDESLAYKEKSDYYMSLQQEIKRANYNKNNYEDNEKDNDYDYDYDYSYSCVN